MSDHNNIDDVFSIADGDPAAKEEHIGTIVPLSVSQETGDATRNPKLNRIIITQQPERSESHQSQSTQPLWGIPTGFEHATQDSPGPPTETQPISNFTNAINTMPNSHRSQISQSRELLPKYKALNGTETIEETVYLRLIEEKARIEFSSLQNPEYRKTNLPLLHRLNNALHLLQEIVSSGTTLKEAQADNTQLDQEILARIHSQVTQQRFAAQQAQEPLDNETRANKNLAPLTLYIAEDLRLKLLKASILSDLQQLI